jgi:hypothetical protein
MKIISKMFLISSMMAMLGGCASVAGDNSKIVHVSSKPAGAKVYVNNIPMGTTPTQIAVNNTWSPTLVTFKKKGYEDTNAQVNTAFQPIGILNVLFWPGFIVDAASGNMMKISPESRTINAELTTVA